MFDPHRARSDDFEEYDERAVQQYADEAIRAFVASPEAKPILEKYGDVGWIGLMIEYAASYIGVDLAEMSTRDFNEILFELFPRKVSTTADSAEPIVEELRAFWDFLAREYSLPNAAYIRDTLDPRATKRLAEELSDPANFGPAKSIVMQGFEAGYDMTTEEGFQQFMIEYNRGIAEAQGLPFPFLDAGGEFEESEGFEAPRSSGPTPEARSERRKKARKAQRQARKRNRR